MRFERPGQVLAAPINRQWNNSEQRSVPRWAQKQQMQQKQNRQCSCTSYYPYPGVKFSSLSVSTSFSLNSLYLSSDALTREHLLLLREMIIIIVILLEVQCEWGSAVSSRRIVYMWARFLFLAKYDFQHKSLYKLVQVLADQRAYDVNRSLYKCELSALVCECVLPLAKCIRLLYASTAHGHHFNRFFPGLNFAKCVLTSTELLAFFVAADALLK